MSDSIPGYPLWDVAALQYLHWADTDHASGDDVYSFAQPDGQIRTIWDGGGHDVLDMSWARYGVTLDLAVVAISAVAAKGTSNLAIADGTVIESAIGSAHDDRIIGGDAANTITRGAGGDVLIGRGGANVFPMASGLGRDTISDFVLGEGMLDLSGTGARFLDLAISSSDGDTETSHTGDGVMLLGVTSNGQDDILLA